MARSLTRQGGLKDRLSRRDQVRLVPAAIGERSFVIVVTSSKPYLSHKRSPVSDRLERQCHAPSRDPRRCALELHPSRLASPWLERLALKRSPGWAVGRA